MNIMWHFKKQQDNGIIVCVNKIKNPAAQNSSFYIIKNSLNGLSVSEIAGLSRKLHACPGARGTQLHCR